MNKPIMVSRQEFIENLVALINQSNLPLIVIEPILQGVLSDVNKGIQQQYEKEKADYEEALKKEGSDGSNN